MSYLKEHVAEFDADELAKVTDARGVQHLSHQPLQSVSFTHTPHAVLHTHPDAVVIRALRLQRRGAAAGDARHCGAHGALLRQVRLGTIGVCCKLRLTSAYDMHRFPARLRPDRHSSETRPPRPDRSTTLADVVQAEARMGWADQRLAELVAGHAEARMGAFDAGHLAELMAGLASVG